MKKNLLTLSMILSGSILLTAQNGANQKWSQNGDNVSNGAWLGTTNSQALELRANNTLGIKIKPDGVVVLKSLDLNSNTGPNGLVYTDGQGRIDRLNFTGDATKVLLANGTWGTVNMPGQWKTSGNNLYWNDGNVGVGGLPDATFKFTVTGDARVSNDLFVNHDLFVGGGIITSDKVQAVTEIKGWDFKVDNDLDVNGRARFSGSTQMDQGVTFDGSRGIAFVPVGNGGIFRYGNNSQQRPLAVPCAAAPTTDITHQFGGIVQVFDASDPVNSGLLNLQTWTGGSSIDASVGGNLGAGGLLIDYFCHNNTFINTGWDIPNGVDGGTVYMGAKVDMQNSLKIGWNPNPTIDLNTSIDINNYANNGNCLKLNTWNNSVKFLSISNPNFINSPFTVYADGRTHIGDKTQVGFHSDAMLTVNGKMVAQSCYIKAIDWADYVFEPGYKVPSLYDVEKFYLANKHLPEIPSEKEVLEDGVDIVQMNKLLLKKMEEMTIMMVQQQKEIDALKAKIK